MVLWVLNDSGAADKLKTQAYSRVIEEFNWREIASQTVEVYRDVWMERRNTNWYSPDARQGGIFDRMTRMFGKTS
jgi:hypothetical protein